MTYISYRDAFNQLGDAVFKGTWQGDELKNASLYDNYSSCGGWLNLLYDKKLSREDIPKAVEKYRLLLIKEIEKAINGVKEGTKEKNKDIEELKKQGSIFKEHLAEWQDMAREICKEEGLVLHDEEHYDELISTNLYFSDREKYEDTEELLKKKLKNKLKNKYLK